MIRLRKSSEMLQQIFPEQQGRDLLIFCRNIREFSISRIPASMRQHFPAVYPFLRYSLIFRHHQRQDRGLLQLSHRSDRIPFFRQLSFIFFKQPVQILLLRLLLLRISIRPFCLLPPYGSHFKQILRLTHAILMFHIRRRLVTEGGASLVRQESDPCYFLFHISRSIIRQPVHNVPACILSGLVTSVKSEDIILFQQFLLIFCEDTFHSTVHVCSMIILRHLDRRTFHNSAHEGNQKDEDQAQVCGHLTPDAFALLPAHQIPELSLTIFEKIFCTRLVSCDLNMMTSPISTTRIKITSTTPIPSSSLNFAKIYCILHIRSLFLSFPFALYLNSINCLPDLRSVPTGTPVRSRSPGQPPA